MEELVKGIEGTKLTEAFHSKAFRDGAKRDTRVVLTFPEEVLPERVFLGCLLKLISTGGRL